MSTRSQVLTVAILGQLQRGPMHGYELRKQLNASLGTVRALSYGSLYPALRSLTERGLIEAEQRAPGQPLAGRRSRIVYRLTRAGTEYLANNLATAGPASWSDEAFNVRFSLFGVTAPATRLRILEGRRARMVERAEQLRESRQRGPARTDSYAAELLGHRLEVTEREIAWLQSVIDDERRALGPPRATTRQLDPVPLSPTPSVDAAGATSDREENE